jgi:hypothetical protein
VETAVMAVILEALRRMTASMQLAAVVSACAWSAWHAYINHPAQAPSILWGFWVFSVLYLRARTTSGVFSAALLVVAAHAFNNFIALLFILAKDTVLVW